MKNEEELKLDELIDVDVIQTIQDSFCTLTGFASITTDIDGKPVTKPTNFTKFCTEYTRSTKIGCELCEKCDSDGAKLALSSGEVSTYTCHAGLLDFAAPIVANDKLVGCFIAGQILTGPPDLDKARAHAVELGLDPDGYAAAISDIQVCPTEQIDKAKEAFYNMAFVLSTIASSNYKQRKLNEEIEHAANMKSDFLANMSHEIRTPMNAVIGMADMALRENLPPAARNHIRQIKSSGKSLLTIINDILDFSKIESGKMDIIFAEYDLITFITEISSIILTRIGTKDIELIWEITPTFPKKLMGDDIRLKQIFINLLNNAVKFTPKGQIVVTLDYVKLSEFELQLVVSVEDTGIGIKPEDLDKLFQSFQQLDSKRNRNIEGTGLGLAITQRLLELMYGKISVESTPNKGSIFSFTLPQRIVTSVPICTVNDPEAIHAAGLIGNSYQRASILHDIQSLRLSYKEFLSADELFEAEEGSISHLLIDYALFTPAVEQYVINHPNITAALIIKFNAEVSYGIPNLVIIRQPVFCYNITKFFNGEDILDINYGTEDSDIDFIAPDAKILMVDDNLINLTVATGLLEPLRMQIDTAVSGKEAIEKITEKHYDLIFMDHMMPEVDGIETTHIIRRMYPEYDAVPIIALSANAVAETRYIFLSEGMNDFVAKPIELRLLIAALKRWLPSELQKPVPKDAAQSRSAASPISEETASLHDKIHSLPDLEVDTALQLLGTEELFWKVLGDYYKAIKKKIQLIKEFEVNEDLKNYTIEVHALKSASRQIGATALSEKAASLEQAGNNENLTLIHQETDGMLGQYQHYLEVLAPYFVEDSLDNDDKPAAEASNTKAFIATLKQAADDFDLDMVENTLKEMVKYSYADEQTALLDELKEAVENIDFSTALEILDKWEQLVG